MLADNDRLMTALFFAILLHGIVILGITFDNEVFNRLGSNELEVVLIEGEGSELAPEDAAYYAEQNQIGSGNTDEDIDAIAAQASIDPFANDGELGYKVKPRLHQLMKMHHKALSTIKNVIWWYLSTQKKRMLPII